MGVIMVNLCEKLKRECKEVERERERERERDEWLGAERDENT
jgi:hypothetical protein